MKIVITGAAGMIGSYLVDRFLKEGHQVIGIDDFSFGNNQKLKIGFLSSDRKDGIGEDDIYAFKFNPRLAGVEDFYEYNFSDTLIVAKKYCHL